MTYRTAFTLACLARNWRHTFKTLAAYLAKTRREPSSVILEGFFLSAVYGRPQDHASTMTDKNTALTTGENTAIPHTMLRGHTSYLQDYYVSRVP
jgi:hypothetical protein